MSKKVCVMLVASCANLFSSNLFCFAEKNGVSDDVVIMSREQFENLQKTISQLQESIDSLKSMNRAVKSEDSFFRNFVTDIVCFVLLTFVVGCFYVVYDYLFRFRREAGHENQNVVGYLMSLFKTNKGGTLLDIFDGMQFLLDNNDSVVNNILNQIILYKLGQKWLLC